jgi:hypothetical protein
MRFVLHSSQRVHPPAGGAHRQYAPWDRVQQLMESKGGRRARLGRRAERVGGPRRADTPPQGSYRLDGLAQHSAVRPRGTLVGLALADGVVIALEGATCCTSRGWSWATPPSVGSAPSGKRDRTFPPGA